MAAVSRIAPITGRFKNRVMFDVVASSTVGIVLASAFWWGYSVPKMQKFREYDAKVKAENRKVEDAWMQENNYTRH